MTGRCAGQDPWGGREKIVPTYGMCKITEGSTGRGQGDGRDLDHPIRSRSYNIRNGQNGVLESALRKISQANAVLGVFQEEKFMGRIFVRESSRYQVMAEESPSLHCGGVAVF